MLVLQAQTPPMRLNTALKRSHRIFAQCFGDISVLLGKPEPATIRVSSLKVRYWHRCELKTVFAGLQFVVQIVMQIHFGTQAVLWRIHKHDVHKLGVNVVKVSA